MSWDELVSKYTSLWWSKGLRVWNLRSTDGIEQAALRDAIWTLAFGILLSTIAEFYVSLIFFPSAMPDLFGVPLYAGVLASSAFMFTIFVCLSLRLFKSNIDMTVAGTLTAYVLSGLFPLLHFAFIEQRIEAFRLLLEHRDPSLQYFLAATVRLLSPQHAALSATVRVWAFTLLGFLIFAIYIVRLWKVLVGACHARRAGLRVVLSLVLAFGAQQCLVHWYFDRWYWVIILSRLKGQT